MWLLPVLIVGLTVALSIPLGRYLARVLDRGGAAQRASSALLDTGPQTWKQYALAMLLFNVRHVRRRLRRAGDAAVAPGVPEPGRQGDARPDARSSTPRCSFLTNTNLQHYSRRGAPVVLQPAVRRSAGSSSSRRRSAWRRCWPSSAGCAATRTWATSTSTCGAASSTSSCRCQPGRRRAADRRRRADDVRGQRRGATVRPGRWGRRRRQPKPQMIARGPVAAVVADQAARHQRRRLLRRQLGPPVREPDGAGPTSSSASASCSSRWRCVVMFGRMLRNMRHAAVIYGVLLLHARRPDRLGGLPRHAASRTRR